MKILNIDFEHSFNKLERKEIEHFEIEHNVMFPVDYKNFLLSNNGGKPKKRRFTTVDGTITSSIMLFFPISENTDLNIKTFYNKYNQNNIVPPTFLPIGIDPVENLICLQLDENDYVYFCDLDYYEEDNELKPENIKLISKSFKGFLQKLSEF